MRPLDLDTVLVGPVRHPPFSLVNPGVTEVERTAELVAHRVAEFRTDFPVPARVEVGFYFPVEIIVDIEVETQPLEKETSPARLTETWNKDA